MKIGIDDIKDAYKKLKSYVYYDNTSLHLRQKVAEFEHSENFEKSLLTLAEFLQKPDSKKSKNYYNSLINKISYHVIPKKIEPNEFEKDEYVVSNRFQNDSYKVTKITYLIDADIELHLISVLWITKIGYLLTKTLDEGSAAYKLETEFVSGEISKGIKLFKPYYKQYQKWRDNGIQTAKDTLDKGENVVIISLDIKNYYHSVRLSFDKFKLALSKLDPMNSLSYLTDILEQIHTKYTSLFIRDESSTTLLPIGLLSSGIIANWHLRRFDKKIRSEIKPIYYGRYVDDIFIVARDTFKKFAAGSDKSSQNNSGKLFEQYIRKYFIDTESKILTPVNKKGIGETKYKLFGYRNLFIQKNKVKLYLFAANESKAVLNQFEKNIRDNSSEFRFLPEEEIVKKKFEDNAYSITYSDTVNKLRSIEDFKCNKYEASKYLANEIFASRLWDYDEKDKRDTARQILSFFNGRLILEFYGLWEKILTYFVLNDLKREFNFFSQETLKTISKISISEDITEFREGNQFITKSKLEQKIKASMFNYLKVAVAMPVALNLGFIDTPNKSKKKWAFIDIVLSRRIRGTNFVRHSYVFYPLFNYTKLLLSEKYNLFERNIDQYKTELLKKSSSDIQLDNKLIEYSPRFVHFHEATIFVLNRKILFSQNIIDRNGHIQNDFFDLYNEEAFDVFYLLNHYSSVNPNSNEEKNKLREQYPKVNIEQGYNVISVFSSNANASEANENSKINKVNIAVANIKVDEKNLESSINKRPILSKGRKDELFKLLNLVTKEKCDMFIMPETSVPYAWLPLLAKYSHDHQKAIVCGLEHLIAADNIAYNFIVSILPFEIYGYKSCLVKVRLKNHYSPEEEIKLKKKKYIIPRPNRYSYDLFIWNKVYFSCYYCYEIADIRHRNLFRSKVDFLIASVLNNDVNYFSNIVESAARDIHCYFIQVNSSDKGDTRITRPSKTEKKDIIKLKGGQNSTILTAQLDIEALREFQKMDIGSQINNKEEFKVTPPDFEIEWVEKREQGLW